MRRETKVWLAEWRPLAAIPLSQRTDEQRQRLRLLARRLVPQRLDPELISPELAKQLRSLWKILRKVEENDKS